MAQRGDQSGYQALLLSWDRADEANEALTRDMGKPEVTGLFLLSFKDMAWQSHTSVNWKSK